MLRYLPCVCLLLPTLASANPFAEGEWVDLSHSYSDQTLYWPTSGGFDKEEVYVGETDGGYYYSSYKISTAEHGGTHIDAPIHFYEGRDTVDQIPLNRLIGPAVVIDLSDRSPKESDYQISVADILAWEEECGEIPKDSIVLFNTGHAQYWPDAVAYLGTAEKGDTAVPKLHFPGIHPDAARFLAEKRQIAAVGIDTASIDYGQSIDFMTHRILFEHNIPGYENLTNLDQLPAKGSLIVALPMKIKGGSGGPLRAVAFVPK